MNTQFGYNGDGVRLRLVEAGTLTTYTQDYAAPLPVVLQAKTGTTTTQYVYSLGTRPVAEYEAAAWEYLLPDPLGSVRQIAGVSGNVTLLKSYEPYGSVLNNQGTATSVFAYAGEQIDSTGLIYLRARYMQPGLGVFLSRDPWAGDLMRPGSMNGWNYGEANPINRIDPSGLFSAITWARSAGYSADLDGISKWFESMRGHWGWAKLLLDAEDTDFVWVRGGRPVWELKDYGVLHCEAGKANIHRVLYETGGNTIISDRSGSPPTPAILSRTGWRKHVFAERFSRSGLSLYRDGGDSGSETDLPDVVLLGGLESFKPSACVPHTPVCTAPVNGALFIDRFGTKYAAWSPAGVGISLGIDVYGEGYVSPGGLLQPWDVIWDKEQLRDAITGVSFAGEIKLAFGGVFSMGKNKMMMYTVSAMGAIGVSISLTDEADEDPSLAWDWMLHVRAPSRQEVWEQALKSYQDNPCGECSLP